MPSPRQLIEDLLSAFGDPAAIEALLTEDAEWWITPTVGVLASPTRGRREIRAGMDVVFGDLYGDARAEIRSVIAEGDTAAARFTLHATARFADDRPYENEYSIWIEQRGDLICRVWEYLDVAHAAGQFDLEPPAG